MSEFDPRSLPPSQSVVVLLLLDVPVFSLSCALLFPKGSMSLGALLAFHSCGGFRWPRGRRKRRRRRRRQGEGGYQTTSSQAAQKRDIGEMRNDHGRKRGTPPRRRRRRRRWKRRRMPSRRMGTTSRFFFFFFVFFFLSSRTVRGRGGRRRSRRWDRRRFTRKWRSPRRRREAPQTSKTGKNTRRHQCLKEKGSISPWHSPTAPLLLPPPLLLLFFCMALDEFPQYPRVILHIHIPSCFLHDPFHFYGLRHIFFFVFVVFVFVFPSSARTEGPRGIRCRLLHR